MKNWLKIISNISNEQRFSILTLLVVCILISPSTYSLDVTAVKGDVKTMEEIEVEGTIEKGDRAYTQQDGKRFITNPYGVKKSILAVAEETKNKGERKRISTRGIKMPPDYVGRSIYRYQYTFPSGGKFSYYEGKDGFIGLGYHSDDGVIVLDVLDGAGPFASPMLWGPYDQIVGDKKRSTMEMMMGDGSQDGMGLLKSGYAIAVSYTHLTLPTTPYV